MQKKRAMKTSIKLLLILFVVSLCSFTVLILMTPAALLYDTLRDVATWRDKTKPLDTIVVQDLCKKFELPLDDRRCQADAIVYAPDFFGTIRQTFFPENRNWATFEEVERVLGKYKFKQEPLVTTGDGLKYFVARYDLKGDRIYPITIFFHEDGKVWRMFADITD
jgi:hypothetical protein